jgi:putative Mn2+ efflux pump MntP
MVSYELPLLALALSMDATAVAMTSGFAAKRVRARDALLLAFLFGAFQALMPVIGWAAGVRFAHLIAAWDHWVAFVLLCAIGGKMIYEAFAEPENPAAGGRNPFGLKVLLVLAVATSIDALVAGLTLPLLDVRPFVAAAIIGVVTFVLSLAGVVLGRRFGDALGSRLDVIGGVILIGLGVKTLAEHLSAG